MSKTRRLIFSDPIPDEPKASVKAELYYRKDARVRGYYFNAIVERVTDDRCVSWILGEMSKTHLIEQATRFNEREFNLIQISDELKAQVKEEALASIRH